ncbi:hypothetical protein ACOME3_004450 [Neoechinorhynchus agilis]
MLNVVGSLDELTSYALDVYGAGRSISSTSNGAEFKTALIFDTIKRTENKKRKNTRKNWMFLDCILSIMPATNERMLLIYSIGDLNCYKVGFSCAEKCAEFYQQVRPYQKISPDQTHDEDQPTVMFDYKLDSNNRPIELGHGTFGTVFLGYDLENPLVKYAIKHIYLKDSTAMETIYNEIKILSTLKHRNIVHYHDCICEGSDQHGIVKIVLEYVDGGSLDAILRGLQYLHENHIIHRDIKGANILLNQYNGEVKIADFGASKRLAGLSSCLDDLIGTIQYMAPDVINVPDQGYGYPADIWSFGCTVIEMATGKPPFSNEMNEFALLLKIGSDNTHPNIPDNISPDLKNVLDACFQSEQKNRPKVKKLLEYSFFRGNKLHDYSSVESLSYLTVPNKSFYRVSSDPSPEANTTRRVYSQQTSRKHGIKHLLQKILSRSKKEITDALATIMNDKRFDKEAIEKLVCSVIDYISDESNGEFRIRELISHLKEQDINNEQVEQLFHCLIPSVAKITARDEYIASTIPHLLFTMDNMVRQMVERFVEILSQWEDNSFTDAPHISVLSADDVDSKCSWKLTGFRSLSESNSVPCVTLNEGLSTDELRLQVEDLSNQLAKLCDQVVATETRYSLLLQQYIEMKERQKTAVSILCMMNDKTLSSLINLLESQTSDL